MKKLELSVDEGPLSGDRTDYQLSIAGEGTVVATLMFQDGPVKENGQNGAQTEDIIGVLLDRLVWLQGKDEGKYACRENAIAITKLQEARMWLQERTRGREERGVEGTDTP